MTRTQTLKHRLISSLMVIVMLTASFVGTTFAWFTDEVTSAGNKIESGNLLIDLIHEDENGPVSLKENTDHKPFNYDNWEPGYTEVETFKIKNYGSLALRYRFSIEVAAGTAVLGKNGENLADVIDVYLLEGDASVSSFDEITAAGSAWVNKGTLTKVMENPASFLGGTMQSGDEKSLKIALHMQESAGNEYQSLSVGDIYINLVATQWTYEGDSFDDQYDNESEFPLVIGKIFSASAPVTVNANNEVESDTAIGGAEDNYKTTVPAGVLLDENVTELTLDIDAVSSNNSEANFSMNAGDVARYLDVHVEGVSENNTVPMVIDCLGAAPAGLLSNNINLYHVENGVTVTMTAVDSLAELDAHNEYYYNSATGDIHLCMASFSEVAVAANVENPWDGTTANTAWYDNNVDASEFTLADVEDFVGFRNLVDGGNSFAGKTVILGSDINLGGHNFDPIGWGYDYAAYNRDGVEGKTFKGIFDGNNHTIYNLYQHGWDLESANGTDYTYTNCGFGLFAAACDATIKNLTVSGANIVAECVEMGIVVGLAQGNCTFENITVEDSKIANYQRPAGGVVGEVSPKYNGSGWEGTFTFENITVRHDVVVGSLWGDFDAPVGGVIGARWDDANVSTVNMTDVTVACRLDVYSDVTAAYEWYAYRRAGMLIGNTDTPPADGKNSKVATADFLTCSNVNVYYGNWVNYTYCQFTNQDDEWCNGYPWVRVQAGENCSAYSNPRYGQPVIGGVTVNSADHTHADGDECSLLIKFDQLYGGGQGVYGQASHGGVTIKDLLYTITYMYNGEILDVVYVTDNTVAVSTANKVIEDKVTADTADNLIFDKWVNAGGQGVAEIAANNTANVTIYPSWKNSIHTARFVDQDGNVIYEVTFREGDTSLAGEPTVPEIPLCTGAWENYSDKLANAQGDIVIYPVYTVNESNVVAVGIDIDGDGVIDYYEVGSVDLQPDADGGVTIPGEINGIPVKVVTGLSERLKGEVKNIEIQEGVEELTQEAFAHTPNMTQVWLPSTINKIGANTFSVQGQDKKENLTIYYAGTKADWDKITLVTDWNKGMRAGSMIVCSDYIGEIENSGKINWVANAG